MKVYTKTGDKGKTSLFGGKRVLKNDIRIDAYGTVDELNSWIGLLRDSVSEEAEVSFFIEIQETLFTLGSYLATDPAKKEKVSLPKLEVGMVDSLERKMDIMEEDLPEMKNFVLPGGHKNVSYCHIARTVCRRAERAIVAMDSDDEDIVFTIKYINRLSDYLFVLSRKWTQDLNAKEIPWNPKM